MTQGTSGYSGSAGFQVGVVEEYLLGKKADGAFYFDDLASPTRSVSWQHSMDIGKVSLDLNSAIERYDEDTPYTKRINIGLSRRFGNIGTRLTTNWSDFDANQNGVAEYYMDFPQWRFGKTGMGLSFAPYLGYQHTVIAATDSAAAEKTSDFYQGLRLSLGFPQWRLLGGTLSPTANNDIAHDSAGEITNYLDTGLCYRRALGPFFSSSVTYGYSLSHSNKSDVASQHTQRLSLDLSGHYGTAWNLYAYSNYSIE